jgi:hypothetical protein
VNKRLRVIAWNEMKNYVNSNNVGDIITRQDLIKNITMNNSTLDTYRNYLKHLDILETVKRGRYKLKRKIPEELNTTVLGKLLTDQHINKWKRWFMPLDDRIKRILKNEKRKTN